MPGIAEISEMDSSQLWDDIPSANVPDTDIPVTDSQAATSAKTKSTDIPPKIKNNFSKNLFTFVNQAKLTRLSKKKLNAKKEDVVDLDAYKSSTSTTKWWIQNLHLLDSDKTTITSGAWLSASIINASQHILAAQFATQFNGAGFQDVGNSLTMEFDIESTRFVQIIHDNDRNHWITLTNIGTGKPEEIFVFDSVFSCSSPCIRTQVGSLLHTSKSQFSLNFVDVHKQCGGNDWIIFYWLCCGSLSGFAAWCFCV